MIALKGWQVGWKVGFLLLAFAALAPGQRYDQNVLTAPTVNSSLPLARTVPNNPVAVCTQPANLSTTPCSPLATLYTDGTLTQTAANPTMSDANGNLHFYAPCASGPYVVQVYGPNITPPFTLSDQAQNCYVNEYYADQYLAGSTTGGIAEAYAACQTNSVNPTGCHVGYQHDETISTSGGTVTVVQGKPLYIDFHGHTLNLACTTGFCLTFNANVPGGSANFNIEHGQVQYTGGVSGSNVTAGIKVIGTDYMAVRDVTFGPQSGTHPTITSWMLLANAEDNIFENVNFINAQSPITLGTGNTGTTPGGLTLFERCTFNGNAAALQIVSASSQVWFMHDDWEANTAQTLVNIDNSSGQNIAMIHFQDNVLGNNGDGTSSTALFVMNSAALQANSQIIFEHNDLVAGIPGANATVYKFTGAGTPNFYFRHENNLYSGPFGQLFSGFAIGQFNISENEECSAWSCTDRGGDVLINSPTFGSGSVVVNGYFGDSLAATASGFIRLSTSDTVNFRNQGSTADITALSKNTSDQLLIGQNGVPTLTYRALDSLQTTIQSADLAFSGWGTTSGLTIASNAKDQGGLIVWTAGTTSSNPTVTLTFHDGTWTNRPFCQAWFQDNSSPAANTAFMSGTNATHMVAEWIGTPSNGDIFQLQWECRSGG